MFCSNLGNAALQRYLLAVETPTLESVIHAGSKFGQVLVPNEKTCVAVRCVDELGHEEAGVSAVSNPEPQSISMATMQQLMREMERMAD